MLRYSKDARIELREIGQYTRETWGHKQAIRYLRDLRAACRRLAQNPFLGPADSIRPNIRRKVQGKHVIFYRQVPDGVTIVRILHHSQSPGLNLPGDPR